MDPKTGRLICGTWIGLGIIPDPVPCVYKTKTLCGNLQADTRTDPWHQNTGILIITVVLEYVHSGYGQAESFKLVDEQFHCQRCAREMKLYRW